MCGYMIDEKNMPKLRSTGVKDSKLLAKKKRESIEKEIKKIAEDFIVLSISAAEIDRMRTRTNLNRIEIERMQEIINALEPDKVTIDAPEADTEKFHSKVSQKVKNRNIEIVAENFADKNHIEVAAASVIAKVERDNKIKELHKKHGFFGSGYTSDERTVTFLKNWIENNKEFPGFVRKSWLTAQWIKSEKEQKSLAKWG